MFNNAHIFNQYQLIKWNIENPDAIIAKYRNDIRQFTTELKVPGLACTPESVNIGGALFGQNKVDAMITTLGDSKLYSASLGLAYGPRSVLLVTFCCASDFLSNEASDAYVKAKLASLGTVKKRVDFEFMEATMEAAHIRAIEATSTS